MSIRKNLSSVVVFSSVFIGSIIGEGINIITAPNSIRDLFRKLNGNFDVVRETVKEKVDDATIMLIETSALAITKTKMNINTVSKIADRYKSKTLKPSNKYKLAYIPDTKISNQPSQQSIINTSEIQLQYETKAEIKPKVRRIAAKKSDIINPTESAIISKPQKSKKKPAAKKTTSKGSTDKI